MEFPLFNTPIWKDTNMAKSRMTLSAIALEGERVEAELEAPRGGSEEVVEISEDETRREERFEEMSTSMGEVTEVEETTTDDAADEADDEGDAELPETSTLDDDYEARQSEEFAIESLNGFRELLCGQLERGTATMESIQVIQHAIQNVYASQGVRMRTIATESAMTVEAFGRFVLENLALEAEHGESGFLKRVGNVIGTLRGKADSTHKLYEQRIEDLRQEYNEKKQLMKGPIHMNMAGGVDQRWHFFSTDKGQSANLVQDVARDTQLSKYVMFDYAPKALDAMKKILQMVGSLNPKDEQGYKAALLQIEKLQAPITFFNQQFVTGAKKPYFGVTGVDIKVGAQRKAVTVDGVTFQKLAEMASPRYAYETSSFKHGVKKFFGVSGGNKKTAIDVPDVDALMKGAEEYNNAVGQSVKILAEAEAVMHEAIQAALKVHNAWVGLVGSNSPKGQLLGVIDASAMAIITIVRDEQRRAMAGAMHSIWAAMYSIEGLTKQGSKGVQHV